jgi:hypothetical protein
VLVAASTWPCVARIGIEWAASPYASQLGHLLPEHPSPCKDAFLHPGDTIDCVATIALDAELEALDVSCCTWMMTKPGMVEIAQATSLTRLTALYADEVMTDGSFR